jgi:hypothetical protein
MKKLSLAVTAMFAAAILGSAAAAHEGHGHGPPSGLQPPPLAILQLDQVREAAAKFADPADAEKAGYADIGLFVPNMGWHYLNATLRDDGRFEVTRPELLVYADDPCGGKRKLVAVEYAVPLSMSKKAPTGFFGRADQWDANQTFQLWTLHAWVYEFNPDGVFAPMNPRVQ